MARLHLGRTLIHQGQCEEGQALLDGAVDHSRQHGIPFDLIQTLYWAADSLRVQGGTDEAAALFDEVLALGELQALPLYPTVGRIGRLATIPSALRPLVETADLVQRARMSGERWGDVTFLCLLAETQQAYGDIDAALDTVATGFDACAPAPCAKASYRP